jgi:hypothetical protein
MPKIDSTKEMNVKTVKYSFAEEAISPNIMKPAKKIKIRITLP